MAKRSGSAPTTKRPAPKPLKDRPIYLEVKKMIDPATGELVGVLAPDSWASKRIMRERKLRTGDVLRATITLPRNAAFFRLVHQLGALVRANLPSFQGLTSHETIKRLQRESGIQCEIIQINAAPVVDGVMAAAQSLLGPAAARMLGAVLPEIKLINVLEPKSIAYDTMCETDFREFWAGICAHLVERYWPSMTTDQITKLAELMPSSEGE